MYDGTFPYGFCRGEHLIILQHSARQLCVCAREPLHVIHNLPPVAALTLRLPVTFWEADGRLLGTPFILDGCVGLEQSSTSKVPKINPHRITSKSEGTNLTSRRITSQAGFHCKTHCKRCIVT